MFRFEELSLIGWDLWPTIRIPLDRNVVIVTGPNGSGKTTLLDALRQLLNARRLSSRRRLQHYLRRPNEPALIRAVVSNRGADAFSVPFRRERILTPRVTLACALVPGGSGAPEKRFAVLPDRPDLGELRRILIDSRDWIRPERYVRILENAGVTRSLLGVLAIEQGRTNSLFELRPRELFRRVLDMLGDRAVLERYRDARRRYEESERALARQAAGLQIRQAELAAIVSEVKRLDDWEEARDRVADLEARVPAADLMVRYRERDDAGAKIPELATKVSRGENERLRLAAAVAAETADQEAAARALAAAKSAEAEAQAIRIAAERREAETAARVTDLAARERAAAAIPVRDEGELESDREEKARSRHEIDARVETSAAKIRELETRRDRLEAGLSVWPAAVAATVARLRELGVAARLLAETVEPSEETTAAALEAALGNARFSLIVSPADAERALDVARKESFPGPVYEGPTLPAATGEGPIHLEAGAPAWVTEWLAGIDLSDDGSWRDLRGTWSAPVAARVLGASGREAALAACRAELDVERAARDILVPRLEAARESERDASRALEQERHRRRLQEEVATLPRLREDLAARSDEAARAREVFDLRRADREAAADRLTEKNLTCRRAMEQAKDQERRLEGERAGLEELRQAVVRLEREIAEAELRVTEELRERAKRGDLDGPDTVREDLDRARARFDDLGEPPAPEVRAEADHLRSNVVEMERHVTERQREAEEARSELSECRNRYLEIVSGALKDYRRRVTDLAEIAGVAAEMELPRLTADDRTLDEAEIRASFGFDGKEPLPVGDPSFSGGQQVIVGLVLLMGMAETEGHGFFMLDEPFAHLSLDRVDQVGRFLRGTNSQFILTAPTTLDRAQLDPASRVIVLSKKRSDQAHAPVPIVAEV